ncbi:MAG: magnesium transporter CorA family protein [bacterium]
MNKKTITFNDQRWVSLTSLSESEKAFLVEDCHFLRADVEACLTLSQRSKITRSTSYLFLVLLFPSYNREKKVIEPFELDIFLTKTLLVTIQERPGVVLSQLVRSAEESEEVRAQLLDEGPVRLFEILLQQLLTATFPMIDHISIDVREIERRLFAGNERAFLEDLLIVRRNIAVFRKTMHAHKFIIRKLVNTLTSRSSFSPLGDLQSAFENLVEHTKEIWDALEVQKEEVETLAETNESLISHRLNEIMKKFTTISVMIFAMTLVATILNIGAHGTPLLGIRHAFWYILLLESAVAGVLYGIFRRKRWL